MKDLFKEAQAAAAFISERCQQLPDTAIVLGTGLDHILDHACRSGTPVSHHSFFSNKHRSESPKCIGHWTAWAKGSYRFGGAVSLLRGLFCSAGGFSRQGTSSSGDKKNIDD
jgi:hypothetical protein